MCTWQHEDDIRIKIQFKNIKSIAFEWTCYGPIRKDTTPIFDLAVHPISILYYLFPDGGTGSVMVLFHSTYSDSV